MQIEKDTIVFKSSPEFYFKERDGHKCNTIRHFYDCHELESFDRFRQGFDFNKPNKKIKIWEATGKEGYFVRTITDISFFNGYYIISWRHDK